MSTAYEIITVTAILANAGIAVADLLNELSMAVPQ